MPYVPSARINARRIEVSGWNSTASMNCSPWASVGLAVGGRRSNSAARVLGSASRGLSQLTMKLLRRGSALWRSKRHDLGRFPHAKESNRRPSLTFRQLVLGLFRDHRAVPDRSGDGRSLWRSLGDRKSHHAIALCHKFPALLELSSGIETKRGLASNRKSPAQTAA